MNFQEQYGEWALVAGGSEGMGGAYSDYLAERGLNVVVTGRRQAVIDDKRRFLETNFGVKTRGITVDFGKEDAARKVINETADLFLGMFVYNAGLAYVDQFINLNWETESYRLNVNVKSALELVLHFGKRMVQRKHGGIILVSSTAGLCGSPYFTTYSATKGYLLMLGESLWGEFKDSNVDVLAIVPGNTIGQNFKDVPLGTPGFMTGREVVEEAFSVLGKYPSHIAGEYNRDMFQSVYNRELRMDMVANQKKFSESFLK